MVKSEGSRQTFKGFSCLKKESRSKVARVHGRINPTVLRWERLKHLSRRDIIKAQASTHRKCQCPEYRWGLTFKAD